MRYKPFTLVPTMLFHQLHYFVYAYTAIYIAYQYFISLSFSQLSAFFWSSFFFGISWVIYCYVEPVLRRMFNHINYCMCFFIGHTFLLFCMLAMTYFGFVHNYLGFSIFWMLAGFGGGTVFSIKHISDRYESLDMETSEDIGHILGPTISIIIIINSSSLWMAAAICSMASSIFVALTLLFGALEKLGVQISCKV